MRRVLPLLAVFLVGFAPVPPYRPKPDPGKDELAQYDTVKSAIQEAFIDAGATLSHHHAVGTEHARWLEEDISAPGVAMLNALFSGIDPGGNLNPGKIA